MPGHGTVSKTGNLRKDEPDPVAGFPSGAEFSEDGVVGGFLVGEEAVEVMSVGHGLCQRHNLAIGPAVVSKTQIVFAFPLGEGIGLQLRNDLACVYWLD